MPTRSKRAIEGLRTVLTIVVLIHHIDIINPILAKENVLWSSNRPQDTTLTVLGTLISIFNGYLSVTIFFLVSGYVLSFECFRAYSEEESYGTCCYNLIIASMKIITIHLSIIYHSSCNVFDVFL